MPNPQPKPRASKPRTPKRGEIAEAAVTLFSSRPYHEVRLEDVAESAGVSKGTIYTYFESKDHLLVSLIRDGLGELSKRLQAQVESGAENSVETLRGMIRAMIEFYVERPELMKVMRGRQSPEFDAQLGPEGNELFRIFEKEIRRGIRAGELNDSKPAWTARYVSAAIAEILWEESPTVEALTKHISGTLINGLRVQ